jgi:membrane-associated phospholipid phosphatase
MNTLANAVSISAFAVPMVQTVAAPTRSNIYLFALLLVANVAVAVTKMIFGNAGWRARPAGARDCDLLCIGGPAGGQPGFPSGHMTTVTFWVVATWLRSRDRRILWWGVPWIAAMAWARAAKSCHNWQQILGGMVFGGAAGYFIDKYS